jgi:hypothetical protein
VRDDQPVRFNPPPNWPPPPPGWTPPPDWQPDPSWGPPPPNWPLWVPDTPKKRTGLIAGVTAGVFALAAIVVLVLYFTVWSQDSSSAQSDEAQIRVLVQKYQAAWNDNDYGAMKSIMCKEGLSRSVNEDSFKRAHEEHGKVNLTVESVSINGDTATAAITDRDNDKSPDFKFVRDDGAWKWCGFAH